VALVGAAVMALAGRADVAATSEAAV
jgi:hypothetical protein